MAEFPSLPLFTDAFLADTTHLSDAERGRYLLILMHLWRAPGCRLPNDRAWLARKFGRSPEAFDLEIRPLLDEFCETTGNWVTQKRLAREFDFLQERRVKQSGRAKSRWKKEKGRSRGSTASGNALSTPMEESSETIVSSDSSIPPPPSLRSGGAPPGELTLVGDEPQSKPKRATRLPPDWQPDDRDRLFASQLGLDPDSVAANFRDYWHAKAGKDAAKLDWSATWRGWCRRDAERGGGRRGGDRGSQAWGAGMRQMAEDVMSMIEPETPSEESPAWPSLPRK